MFVLIQFPVCFWGDEPRQIEGAPDRDIKRILKECAQLPDAGIDAIPDLSKTIKELFLWMCAAHRKLPMPTRDRGEFIEWIKGQMIANDIRVIMNFGLPIDWNFACGFYFMVKDSSGTTVVAIRHRRSSTSWTLPSPIAMDDISSWNLVANHLEFEVHALV